MVCGRLGLGARVVEKRLHSSRTAGSIFDTQGQSGSPLGLESFSTLIDFLGAGGPSSLQESAMPVRKLLWSFFSLIPAVAVSLTMISESDAEVRRVGGAQESLGGNPAEAEDAPAPRTKKAAKEKKPAPAPRSSKTNSRKGSRNTGKYQVVGTPAEGGIIGQYTPGGGSPNFTGASQSAGPTKSGGGGGGLPGMPGSSGQSPGMMPGAPIGPTMPGGPGLPGAPGGPTPGMPGMPGGPGGGIPGAPPVMPPGYPPPGMPGTPPTIPGGPPTTPIGPNFPGGPGGGVKIVPPGPTVNPPGFPTPPTTPGGPGGGTTPIPPNYPTPKP